MMMNIPENQPATSVRSVGSEKQSAAMEVARNFEAMFLAQMLREANLNHAIGGGGGAERDTFADMLVVEYANALADQQPIGIAEQVYQSLVPGEPA